MTPRDDKCPFCGFGDGVDTHNPDAHAAALTEREDRIEQHDYEAGGNCPERICWCRQVRAEIAELARMR